MAEVTCFLPVSSSQHVFFYPAHPDLDTHHTLPALIVAMVCVMRPRDDAITSSSLHASYIPALIVAMDM